jgi:hypothetical protein
MSQLFGTPHQLGYVVRDIGRAMRHWTEVMRVGPFYYQEHLPLASFIYRGQSTDVDLSVAFAYSGTLQIELIQPRGEADSLFHDFLINGNEGLHHIGYLSGNLKRDLNLAEEAGLKLAQYGTILGEGGQFACFESGELPGTAIQLLSLDDRSLGMFQMIRAEAAHWDGSGPVRLLGS